MHKNNNKFTIALANGCVNVIIDIKKSIGGYSLWRH